LDLLGVCFIHSDYLVVGEAEKVMDKYTLTEDAGHKLHKEVMEGGIPYLYRCPGSYTQTEIKWYINGNLMATFPADTPTVEVYETCKAIRDRPLKVAAI
jgi:hypothetical protein